MGDVFFGSWQEEKEAASKDPVRRKKRPKTYVPSPDSQPSSEYCTETESEKDCARESTLVALHENLHEELYGLPTPKKPERSESAPTELDKSPVQTIDSDDDDDPEPCGETAGTHKDQKVLSSLA